MSSPPPVAQPTSNCTANMMRASPLVIPSPEWVASGDECNICGEQFTTLRRRHHCRCCGELCCSTCSPDALPLLAHGLVAPQRVCMQCVPFTQVLVDAAALRLQGSRIVTDTTCGALTGRLRAAAKLVAASSESKKKVFIQQGGLYAILHLAWSPMSDLQVGSIAYFVCYI